MSDLAKSKDRKLAISYHLSLFFFKSVVRYVIILSFVMCHEQYIYIRVGTYSSDRRFFAVKQTNNIFYSYEAITAATAVGVGVGSNLDGISNICYVTELSLAQTNQPNPRRAYLARPSSPT